MDSDTHHHHHQHHRNQEQQQENMNSGLTRYRSAPSSYFSNMINSGMYGEEDLDPFFNNRISSPETEGILSRFISGGDNLSSHQNLNQIQGNDFMGSMKHKQENYSSQSQEQQQMMYQNHGQSHEIVHNIVSSSPMVDPPTNLDRQSSSPAGFFEHNNIDNGYSMMRSMNKFHPANGSIPEHDGRTMSCNNGGFEETHTKAGGYSVASFAGGSWDESSMLGDRFLNGFVESDHISSTEDQEQMNDEGRFQSIHASTGLSHQLSLPTSSTELDRLSQFQDNVPFRSRAKRGCATHPRSIAERVRRTRISERMRKLQDLVPNMDKQTSTADMLDLAVDYIKELQNQVETLSDHRTKCTCRKLKL